MIRGLAESLGEPAANPHRVLGYRFAVSLCRYARYGRNALTACIRVHALGRQSASALNGLLPALPPTDGKQRVLRDVHPACKLSNRHARRMGNLKFAELGSGKACAH